MLMLSKMLLLATTKHDGQFDKGNKPYILHPLKVMYLLKTEDEELMCIALGHDLLEDTDCKLKDLSAAGMSKRVMQGILDLTKFPGEDFEEYKAKIKGNVDAVRVKMCDLRHNSDLRRIKGLTEKDLARVQRYTLFYDELKKVEASYRTQQPVEI